MKCSKIVFTMTDDGKFWDVPIDVSKDLLLDFSVSTFLDAERGSETITIKIERVSSDAKSYHSYLRVFRGY